MKKRGLSVTVALILCLGLSIPAFAHETSRAGQTSTVSVGSYGHIGLVDTNGSLWMCGSNEYGQLGNGTTNDSPSTFIKIMDGVRSVSCGENITAAIKTDGSLWMWGSHYGHGLPFDLQEDVLSPQKVMDDVVSVSCGYNHVAVVKADGSLWTWGNNSSGQLGNGTKTDSTVPIRIMDDVIAVSCGFRHTAAIKTDGTLWTWGGNQNGELGSGDMGGNALLFDSYSDIYCQTIPIKVMDGVSSVNCSLMNTSIITTDGSLWVCGSNSAGQLANGAAGTFRCSPIPAKVLDNVASVSCGGSSITAVTTDGSLWGWGGNSSGRLGNNSISTNILQDGTPVQLKPAMVMKDVAFTVCSAGGTLIVKTDGSVLGCGISQHIGGVSNAKNQYGTSIQTVPVQISSLTAKLSSPATIIAKVGGFNDVLETDYYADPVLWAVKNEITSGTTDTTFSPDETCTTAQILTFLWRSQGKPEPTIQNPFSDISPGDYFYNAALWANEKGLVSGSTFGGNTPCTRAATMTYLWKLAGSPSAPDAPFTDVSSNVDYIQAVAWAVQQGITSGTSETTFSPEATCTRGQIVTFLYRAYVK